MPHVLPTGSVAVKVVFGFVRRGAANECPVPSNPGRIFRDRSTFKAPAIQGNLHLFSLE